MSILLLAFSIIWYDINWQQDNWYGTDIFATYVVDKMICGKSCTWMHMRINSWPCTCRDMYIMWHWCCHRIPTIFFGCHCAMMKLSLEFTYIWGIDKVNLLAQLHTKQGSIIVAAIHLSGQHAIWHVFIEDHAPLNGSNCVDNCSLSQPYIITYICKQIRLYALM